MRVQPASFTAAAEILQILLFALLGLTVSPDTHTKCGLLLQRYQAV